MERVHVGADSRVKEAMMNEREIVDTATPGPWTATHRHRRRNAQLKFMDVTNNDEDIAEIDLANYVANGRFIAHFNPEHVGAMLDVLEAARVLREVEPFDYRLMGRRGEYVAYQDAQAVMDAALAKLDALNKD